MAIEFRAIYEKKGEKVSVLDHAIVNRNRRKLTASLAGGAKGLEIGCADGYITAELLQKFSFFVASDISTSYLKRARSRVPDARFTVLDCQYLPFKNQSFDNVILTEVLEHTLSPLRVLEEIRRVLTDDGRLILSVPNNMSLYNICAHLLKRYNSFTKSNNRHIAFFDYGSLQKLLLTIGLKVTAVYTPHFSLPRFDRLLDWMGIRKMLCRKLPQFGVQIMVTAEKCRPRFDFIE